MWRGWSPTTPSSSTRPTGFVFVKLPVGWKFVGTVDPKDVARAPANVVTAMLVNAEESVAANSVAPSRDQAAQP